MAMKEFFVISELFLELMQKCKEGSGLYSKQTIETLLKCFYVDNCVTSVPNNKELNIFISEATELMADAKFDLRGWEYTGKISNNDPVIPLLGLHRNKMNDTLAISGAPEVAKKVSYANIAAMACNKNPENTKMRHAVVVRPKGGTVTREQVKRVVLKKIQPKIKKKWWNRNRDRNRKGREQIKSFHPTIGGNSNRLHRTPTFEEAVLKIIKDEPSTSTRVKANRLHVIHETVWPVLKEQGLHQFSTEKELALGPEDFQPRLLFCRWFLQRRFKKLILQETVYLILAIITCGVIKILTQHLFVLTNDVFQ
ncbi:hypothetical protein CBL_12342 [Carabus blaptoides fortunei]